LNGDPATGFEDGQPVPVTPPEIYFDESPDQTPGKLDPLLLLDTLFIGTRTKDEIAARVLVLAKLLDRPGAPKTVTEFANWLDVPRSSADRIWERILQDLQGGLQVFGKSHA
jgi:hypothetical protein